MIAVADLSIITAAILTPVLCSTAIGNHTLSSSHNLSWAQEVISWQPSEDLKREFPIYLAGFSDEGNPVIFAEYGRWNISGYVQNGKEGQELYFRRIKRLILDLFEFLDGLPDPDVGVILILDAKDVGIRQLTSPSVFKAHVALMRYLDEFSSHIDRMALLNGSFAAKTWLEAVRPVAGNVIGKADVVLGGVAQISAFLSSFMSKSNFSSKYGGSSDFVPIRFF